jgi:hypothetical protein
VDNPLPFTLVNGNGDIPDPDGQTGGHASIIRQAIFADADRDGDEDAAVELVVEAGNGIDQSWYVWIWRDGRATQSRLPMAIDARCGDTVSSVEPVAEGFQVTGAIKEPGTMCAAGATEPFSKVVGIRKGFPVMLRPTYGVVNHCNNLLPPQSIEGSEPLLLRTAPSVSAAPVGPPERFVRYADVEGSGVEEDAVHWRLAVMYRANGESVCGWLGGDGN